MFVLQAWTQQRPHSLIDEQHPFARIQQHHRHGQLLKQELGQGRQNSQGIVGTLLRQAAQRGLGDGEIGDHRRRQSQRQQHPDCAPAQQQQPRRRQRDTRGQGPDPKAQKIEERCRHDSPIHKRLS